MNKFLAGALIIAFAASIATPAILLTNNGGENDEIEELSGETELSTKQHKKTKKWPGKKIPSFKKSSEIKNKYKRVECLKKHYGVGDAWSGNLQGQPTEGPFNQGASAKGCLVVEYYKQSKKKKWNGAFRLIWSVSNEQKGVVTVFNVDASEGKMKLDSSIYVLEKQDTIWALKYGKENSEKELSSGDLANYFPQSGTPTKNGTSDNYWGFDPKIDKICKGNNCLNSDAKTTAAAWSWEKNDTETTLITDWSANYATWFNSLFSEWTNVQTSLKGLKGTWTKN